MRSKRFVMCLATTILALTAMPGGYVPSTRASIAPSRALATPASGSVDRRTAPLRAVLTLIAMPKKMVAFQLGTITASLNRPVSDGTITFTLIRPAPSVVLYSCTPVRGRCSTAWSTRAAGSVTIAARWSGDRRDKPIAAALTVAIHPAAYTYTGTWHGARVGSLTRALPSIAAPRLSRANLIGRLQHFRTNDPAYACLNGRTLDVFVAPRDFPNEYVVHTQAHGVRCPSGTWLYPQTPSLSAPRPVIGAPDTGAIIHGVFPSIRPAGVTLEFFAQRRLLTTAMVASWSAGAVIMRVPRHLSKGASAIRIAWYDRLTGTMIRSAFMPILRAPNTAVPLIIPPTTKVLAPAVMHTLQAPPGGLPAGTRGNLALTFTQITPQLSALKPGDVLVSGVTPATPYGLLRKVTSVTVQGSTVVVGTAPAKLTDAITQGIIDVQGTLISRGTFQPHVHDMSMRPHAGIDIEPGLKVCKDFSAELTAEVKADKAIGRNSTLSGSIGGSFAAEDNVCYSLGFHLKVSILLFQPVQTLFTVDGKEEEDAQVKAGITGSIEWSKEITLATSTPIPTGIPGIIIVPKLNFKVGVEGSFFAGLRVGASRAVAFSVGVSCRNADCSPTQSFERSFTPSVPGLAEAELKFYAGPHLVLMIDDVVGPDLGVQVYLKTTAAATDDPWFTLAAGIEGTLGIELDIMVVHLSESFTLLDRQLILYESSGPYPQSTSTPTSVPTTPSGPPPTPTPTAASSTLPASTPTSVVGSPPSPTSTSASNSLPTSAPSDTPTTTPIPYASENVFAGVGNGQIYQYDATGHLLNVLNTTSGAKFQTGMCFDPVGNLYATNFDAGTMSKFDGQGRLLTYPWGGPFDTKPESCVVDAKGDIYVGEVDGADLIRMFDANGNLLATFNPDTARRGTDWIDLSSDQCTMYYTSESSSVKRFNVCTNTQLPDFATGLAAPCYALRIRANGEVLVACASQVYRLDSTGNTIQTYTTGSVGESGTFFALNLDPDGTCFWTAGYDTGNIYRIDVTTGNVLTTFNAPPLGGDISGLAIFGEHIQGQVTATPTPTDTPSPTPSPTIPPRIYVTNEGSNSVSVIDPGSNTVVYTVTVGAQPFGVAVNPSGSRVYVSNYADDTVSVIDPGSNTVVTTVTVGGNPEGMAVTPDGTRLYVANTGDTCNCGNTVSVVNTISNTVVATVPVGQAPAQVAITPDGTRAYVTNFYGNTISVIDTASNTVVATIPAGGYPDGVAITPDGRYAYVSNDHYNNTVWVVDTMNNTVAATVTVGISPAKGAITPDGSRVYVPNTDTVSVIDTASNTVVATVPVGHWSTSAAVNQDGSRVYVVNHHSNTVSVIDTTSNTVVATVPVGDTPLDVAVKP